MSSNIYNFSHLEALKKVRKRRRITGKELHQVTGVAESSISEFFRGKSNANIITLDKIVDGMEKVSPGARQEYVRELAGITDYKLVEAVGIEQQIKNLPKESKKQLIMAIVESIAHDPEPAVQLLK